MFDFYFQSGEFVGETSNGFLGWIADVSVQIVGRLLGGLLALRLYRTQERNLRNKETGAKDAQRDSKLMYLAFLVRCPKVRIGDEQGS